MDIVSKTFIYLDADHDSREDLLKSIGHDLKEDSRIKDVETFYKDILDREEEVSTYMGDGVAIPHCKTDNIVDSTVVLVRNEQTIDWNDEDEPTDLVFLLSIKNTNQSDDQSHLKVLSRLAQNLMDDDFMTTIKEENDIDTIYNTLKVVEGGENQ